MASASDIRAGSAFVEIYVKNNLFTRGLQAAGDKLKKFGSFADGLVTKAAGIAGLVATPILGAVKEFTDLGKSLVEGSERLGTTVESLDAMHFAAEQAGLSAEDLESAVVRMNRATADAPDALSRLGVDAQRFAGLSLEDKFAAAAEGVKGLHDQSEKTAAVIGVFGRGGASLLPLFSQGAAGIKKATDEARRLGLVMSSDDAKKAAELGKAFDKLKAVVQRTFIQLGAALLPVFERIRAGIEDKVTKLQQVQVLIRNNAGLIESFLRIAKTVLMVAAAWAAFRVAVTQVGTAFQMANSLWMAAASVLSFLLSPLGIITAAVIGLSALILNFATDGRILTDLGEQFSGMADRFAEAWGGIKGALETGNLGLAARIAWLAVQREVMGVWQALRLAWTDTVDFFGDGWDSFVYLLESGWNQFSDFFGDVGKDMAFAFMNAFLEVVRVIQDNTRELRAWLERRGLSTFKDVDVDALQKQVGAAQKQVDQDDAKARQKRDKALADDFQAKRDAREKDRADLEKNLNEQVGDIDAAIKAAQEEVTRAKLGQLVGQAFGAIWGALHPSTTGGPAIPAGAVAAVEARGTFGSSGFGGFGLGGGIAQRQLDEQKKSNKLLGEIDDKLDNTGDTWES